MQYQQHDGNITQNQSGSQGKLGELGNDRGKLGEKF
jgi:hypothetical protein